MVFQLLPKSTFRSLGSSSKTTLENDPCFIKKNLPLFFSRGILKWRARDFVISISMSIQNCLFISVSTSLKFLSLTDFLVFLTKKALTASNEIFAVHILSFFFFLFFFFFFSFFSLFFFFFFSCLFSFFSICLFDFCPSFFNRWKAKFFKIV